MLKKELETRLKDAETEIERLRDLFKTQSDIHRDHIRDMQKQHERELKLLEGKK